VKYTAHATIAGEPKFEVRAKAEPIGIKCSAEGSVRARVGPIKARVGRVPIVLAVPFLGGLQTVGAVGPFDFSTGPVDVEIENFELRCDGVIGSEGLTVGLEGEVDCHWKVDVNGTLPGKVAKASLEFAEADEDLEVKP
jgi:hypothetical protein